MDFEYGVGGGVAVAALSGAVMGSVATSVSWRLPQGLSWVRGRSLCASCRVQLPLHRLVPVLSWLVSKGRARCCGCQIPGRYLAAELIGAVAFSLAGSQVTVIPVLLALFVLGWLLLIAAMVDLAHLYLPDGIVLCIALLGVGCGIAHWTVSPGEGLVAGAGVAAAISGLRAWLGRRRGREVLGIGDIKLFAAAGPWVGLQNMPLLLFGASSLGLILYPVWRRFAVSREMPFGPAIALSFFVLVCMTI